MSDRPFNMGRLRLAGARRGGALMSTAFALAVLVLLTAGVGDVGRLYVARIVANAAAQSAAESGALAGAGSAAGIARAERIGWGLADRAGIGAPHEVRATWSGGSLDVVVEVRSRMFLLELAGREAFMVTGHARAAP